jgi:putative ABC transport system substrate-binding protein
MRVWATRSEMIDGRLPFVVTITLVLGLLCAPLTAVEAQQPTKVPRVGFLSAVSSSSIAGRYEAFRHGLRELGYLERQNIVIDSRYADGKLDRLTELATELVRFNVDVLITTGPTSTRAAKQASVTIPIVMAQDADPVGSGFTASLARPGGNITGLSTLAPELSGKQMEILKEILPRLSRVAVVGTSTQPGNAQSFKETEHAARTFGVQLHYSDIIHSNDIEIALRTASKDRTGAVLMLASPVLNSQRKQIAALAVKSRLPVMFFAAEYVQDDGLMSYAPDFAELFRRAATYVDKILKGANPADLPVEQPKKFEFLINLKAAKQIGLTIPPNVLARADRVIK